MSYYMITADEDGMMVDEFNDTITLQNAISRMGIHSFSNGIDNRLRVEDVWGLGEHTAIIIKGKIIVPTPKEVVKEWNIEKGD